MYCITFHNAVFRNIRRDHIIEKIRTYNFPQGRVTDHRIGFTTHDLQGFLNGNIQPMIDALTVAENAEKLKESEL